MEVQAIQNKILEIRGYKVMLDFDLAILYEVETRVLNQSIKRNKDNFPEDFMFRLTAGEWETISSSQLIISLNKEKNNSSQFVMSSRKHRICEIKNRRFAAYSKKKSANLRLKYF